MKNKWKIIILGILLCFFVVISYRNITSDNVVFVTVFSSEEGNFDISAQINTSSTQHVIHAFNNDDGIYYLFMPSYTKDKKIDFETGSKIDIISQQDNFYTINDDYRLCILYGSPIPSVHISLENDLSYISADKMNVDSGQITFLSPDGNVDYTGNLDEMKGRGNSSWGLDKKPFQMKLSQSIEVNDIPLTDEFSLVTARDYSFLRNKISNELANCMESFTLSCAHIDLYINNEYQGIYELWNKLEPETLGIVNLEKINKSVTDTLASEDQMTTDFYLDDWNNTVTGKWWDYSDVSEDVTGGYILEGDYPLRYNEEASGFILDTGAYIVSKSPKYLSAEQYEYISEYMNECESILYAGTKVDNYDLIREYINVESFISKYLVEEISKNVECSATSQYFYKDANDVLYAGPVWDYDSAYGATGAEGDIDFRAPEGFAAREVPGSFKWWQLLYYNQKVYDALTYDYNHILYPYLNELTANLIPEWETMLTDSAVMNSIKWKRAASIEAARAEYHDQVVVVSDFLKARKEFLYNEWN